MQVDFFFCHSYPACYIQYYEKLPRDATTRVKSARKFRQKFSENIHTSSQKIDGSVSMKDTAGTWGLFPFQQFMKGEWMFTVFPPTPQPGALDHLYLLLSPPLPDLYMSVILYIRYIESMLWIIYWEGVVCQIYHLFFF